MSRSTTHDDTTTRIDKAPPTLDEQNAAYLRDNPDASSTTPRPEHTEGENEAPLREAMDAARTAGDGVAFEAARQRYHAALRKRAGA